MSGPPLSPPPTFGDSSGAALGRIAKASSPHPHSYLENLYNASSATFSRWLMFFAVVIHSFGILPLHLYFNRNQWLWNLTMQVIIVLPSRQEEILKPSGLSIPFILEAGSASIISNGLGVLFCSQYHGSRFQTSFREFSIVFWKCFYLFSHGLVHSKCVLERCGPHGKQRNGLQVKSNIVHLE